MIKYISVLLLSMFLLGADVQKPVYLVIEAHTVEQLTKDVNAKMSEGYKIYGPAQENASHYAIMQTLILQVP